MLKEGRTIRRADGRVVRLVDACSWSPYGYGEGSELFRPAYVPGVLGDVLRDAARFFGLPKPEPGPHPPCEGAEDLSVVWAWMKAPGMHVLRPRMDVGQPEKDFPAGMMVIRGSAHAEIYQSVREGVESLVRVVWFSGPGGVAELETWLETLDWESEAMRLPGAPSRPPDLQAVRSWTLPCGRELHLVGGHQMPSAGEGEPWGSCAELFQRFRRHWEDAGPGLDWPGVGRLPRPPRRRYHPAARGVLVAVPPVLVRDLRDPKRRRLPRIACLGAFESGPVPVGDAVSESSLLRVLWFQDDWAPPVVGEVLDFMARLDWDHLATPKGLPWEPEDD